MAGFFPFLSALQNAVESGDVEKTKRLLVKGGHGVNDTIFNGETPLHIACRLGHTSLVKTLCSMGADVTSTDYQGYTPPLVACNHHNTDAMLAVIEGVVGYDVNKLLLCACNRAKGNYGSLEYHPRNEVVLALLNKCKCDPNTKDIEGKTPLHIASQNGNISIVKALLNNGAELDVKSKDGYTPFSLAVKYEMFPVIHELYKLNRYIKDNNGRSPLHIACLHGNLSLTHLLCNDHADVNAQDSYGDTPLILAARMERLEALLGKYKYKLS